VHGGTRHPKRHMRKIRYSEAEALEIGNPKPEVGQQNQWDGSLCWDILITASVRCLRAVCSGRNADTGGSPTVACLRSIGSDPRSGKAWSP
jgi:hypothetical protein